LRNKFALNSQINFLL